jgi:hypothetical protein
LRSCLDCLRNSKRRQHRFAHGFVHAANISSAIRKMLPDT